MKHTPGPWFICDDGINVYAEPDIAITNQDHPCAPDQDEAEANARLIAMAPRMFDALLAISSMETKESTDHAELSALCISIARISIEKGGN